MKKFLKNWNEVIVTLVFFVIFLAPSIVSAVGVNPVGGGGGTIGLVNPLGSKVTSFCQLIRLLLNAAVVLGVPIAVLFVVWAGFKFVLAQGRPEKISEARQNFLYVIIGIAIFIGASLIASVIINTLKNLGVSSINSC